MDQIDIHWADLVELRPSAVAACLPQMVGIVEGTAMATRNLPEHDLATVRNKAICEALAKIHEVETPPGFKGLLAVIAWRRAINRHEYIHAEERDPRKETSIEENEEYEREDRDYLKDENPTPAESAELNEIVRLLQEGLADLPERTRRLLVGVKCRGLTAAEIGRELGMNEHSVGGFLDAGLLKLEKSLKKLGHYNKLKEYLYAERRQ